MKYASCAGRGVVKANARTIETSMTIGSIKNKIMSNQITSKVKKLEITKTYDVSKPVEAVQMSIVLKNVVVDQRLFTNIKGKNYAHVEGWMLAGMLTGIDVQVDEPKDCSSDREVKYSCTARLYKGDKQIGSGYAICSSKEALKKSFDEYAIYSMAQTRAIGKAYRNKIGFIMKLAGFQPTPSEEMHKVNQTPSDPVNLESVKSNNSPKSVKPGQVVGPDGNPTYVCSKCADPIADVVSDYSIKVYKKRLCRDCQPNKK